MATQRVITPSPQEDPPDYGVTGCLELAWSLAVGLTSLPAALMLHAWGRFIELVLERPRRTLASGPLPVKALAGLLEVTLSPFLLASALPLVMAGRLLMYLGSPPVALIISAPLLAIGRGGREEARSRIEGLTTALERL